MESLAEVWRSVIVLLLVATAQTATATPLTKGVLGHFYKASGRTDFRGFTEQQLIDIPNLAGSQFSISWRTLNPSPGVYDWSYLDNTLAKWGAAGKHLSVEFTAANHTSVGNQVMPDYVFNSVPIVTSPDNGAVFPLFWSSEYQALLGDFITAFANRYDGDERIAYVSVGGLSTRNEPRLASRENAATMPQWISYGFDNWSETGVYYSQGIKPILDLWNEAFKQTRLGMTLTFGNEFSDALLQYLQEKNWIGGSNGFSTRSIDQASNQTWSNRADQYGNRFAYYEFGPAGRDNKGTEPYRTMLEMYQGAIGGSPNSQLAYLPLGFQNAAVETYDEWLAALAYADANLQPITPATLVVPEAPTMGMAVTALAALLFLSRIPRQSQCHTRR